MAIDDLLGNIHKDRMTVTTTLRGKIGSETSGRDEKSRIVVATLKEHIRDLTEQINRLQSGGGMPDLHRREREGLERERRDKELTLALEMVNAWRDVQHGRSEDRLLIREELEEQQRYERMNGAFYSGRTQ